jgi:hypothetical protein
MGLHTLLRGYLYFLYVDDIRTSQETYLMTSMGCYGIILLLVYFKKSLRARHIVSRRPYEMYAPYAQGHIHYWDS